MAGLTRLEEIQANLRDVRARIDAAREAARRSDDVDLIAVTKTWPVADVRLLADLGLRDFGENRDQEARPKAEAFAREDGRAVRWHFIGQLQSNKARSVVQYAAMVHTVDRSSLAAALARATEGPLDVLVQVSADGDRHRGGVPLDAIADLVDRIEAPLRLRGIMAVAPLTMDPDAAFALVASAHERLLDRHPDATIRCIGMSADLEAAVRHGATHVRVGSALLGSRAVR